MKCGIKLNFMGNYFLKVKSILNIKKKGLKTMNFIAVLCL